MSRIHFLYNSYLPNTAVSNRMLAYLNSLDKMNVPVCVSFLLPDTHRSKICKSFKNIKIKYYWEKYYINNRFLKYISYYVYISLFLRRLSKGDKVYIYGEDYLAHKILRVKGVEVFYEKTECPEVALSYNRLYKPSLDKHIDICKRVNALFVISQSLKDYYIKKGISESKIHIINIIVDPERFAGINKKEGTEEYVAYCGTVANNKDGVNDLIKAFSIVSESNPRVKLYIIGAIPSKNDQLENLRLIEELQLKEKVVLTGLISAEQMPSLLKNARVLALARPRNMISQYGFPTKMGEYLLTANPVVVTAVGDIPRFLIDGDNAYVSPAGDISAFAERLIYALSNPEKANEVGKKGQEIAYKYFNSDTESKKLLDVINKVK